MIAAVAAGGLPGAADARETLPAAGTAATGTIVVLGRSVALPPGPWVVAGAGFGRVSGQAPAGYGAIGGVLLLRPADHEPDGFVVIHTNLLPVREGWGPPTACSARDSLFRNGAEPVDGHLSCGYVRAVAAADPWLQNLPAVDAARRAGIDLVERLPRQALVAGLRVGDRRDMMDIRYGFRPPAAAGPGAWMRETMDFDPRRAETVAQLAVWTDAARARAAQRLASEAAEAPPLAEPWSAATARAGEDGIPAWRLGIYKTLTYRVMSSSETFALGYFFTGNLYTSALYTFWQGVTHTMIFYGNELAWEWPRSLPIADLVALPHEGTRDVAAAPARP